MNTTTGNAARKPTPAQAAFLRAAADGSAYRSERIRTLYRPFVNFKPVNGRTLDVCLDAGWVVLCPDDTLRDVRTPIAITPEGRAALALTER